MTEESPGSGRHPEGGKLTEHQLKANSAAAGELHDAYQRVFPELLDKLKEVVGKYGEVDGRVKLPKSIAETNWFTVEW